MRQSENFHSFNIQSKVHKVLITLDKNLDISLLCYVYIVLLFYRTNFVNEISKYLLSVNIV